MHGVEEEGHLLGRADRRQAFALLTGIDMRRPPEILVGRPLCRAVLRSRPRLGGWSKWLRRHDHGELVHETGVGKKLIEEFFPRIDLSHVVDTSGAYIPGHGTPTVILFGRNRKPNGDAVRAVLGIKGEPSTPDDASQGLVWQSLVRQIDRAGAEMRYLDCGCSSIHVQYPSVEHRRRWGGESRSQLDESAQQVLGDLVDKSALPRSQERMMYS